MPRPPRPPAQKVLKVANQKVRRRVKTATMRALKNGPCADCQQTFPPYVMQFDHVRGEKSFTIGEIGALGKTLHDLHEEVAKCDLVCANCHFIRTYQRRHN